MVWLHGGGYTYGSASSQVYNGHNLAKSANVIVVGINHRINVFGYTYLAGHDDQRSVGSGNVGHLDIVAALRWVRENIERFGGDHQNVTIFGESGGGGKVSAVLGMPSAQGLFHKAIVESGSITRCREPAEAAELTQRMCEILGIHPHDGAALQRVPAQKLLDCFNRLSAPSWTPNAPVSPLLVGPVADGVVIPRQPWEGAAPQWARNIPMIIGTNLHETVGFISGVSAKIPNDAALVAKISQSAVLVGVDPQELLPLLGTYRLAMPRLTIKELLVRISTDIGFWRNALEQADLKLHAGGAPVYMYECAWKTPCFGGMWAPHGIEIPFVFDVEHYGVAWDGKDSDALRAAADPEKDRYRVGAQVLAAWAHFAHTGDPSTPHLRWPAYESSSRPTMTFDRVSQVVSDPRAEVRPAVASLKLRQLV
jgi:para-nitrobenzyl esterase